MDSLKFTFSRIASGKIGFSIFWLLAFAIAIDDDRQSREKDRRDQRQRDAKPPRKHGKPVAGPRPF